ncbi:MAG TPA: DinB family protein [Candidatus Nanopelagicales bacterium]|jgi:uncharacterized damage-inducible protein DinB|nr:DinB family protein [Candidatus Nanopelagicales bacterium]
MYSRDLLVDAFDRIRGLVHAAVHDLDVDRLAAAPGTGANPIGWLVWHLTRIQDDHVAGAAGREQVYVAGSWYDRLGLGLDPADTGYGHGPGQVAQLRGVSAELLTGYHDAVHASTVAYLGELTDADLDRVVDTRWDPPVTLGVRLVSVVSDDLQHVGQAAYVRGLLLPGD